LPEYFEQLGQRYEGTHITNIEFQGAMVLPLRPGPIQFEIHLVVTDRHMRLPKALVQFKRLSSGSE
jgi:hypothetical protein